MLLKIMSYENLPDDDQTKGCKIIGNVNEVELISDEKNKVSILRAQYTIPNREMITQRFEVTTNMYLMNDSGKTIQLFTPFYNRKGTGDMGY